MSQTSTDNIKRLKPKDTQLWILKIDAFVGKFSRESWV